MLNTLYTTPAGVTALPRVSNDITRAMLQLAVSLNLPFTWEPPHGHAALAGLIAFPDQRLIVAGTRMMPPLLTSECWALSDAFGVDILLLRRVAYGDDRLAIIPSRRTLGRQQIGRASCRERVSSPV